MLEMFKMIGKPLAVTLAAFVVFFACVLFLGGKAGYDAIPPVQILYGAAHMEWLARGRIAVHSLVAVCLLLVGSMQMRFTTKSVQPLLRLRSIMFGVMMLVIAGWNITIVGLVLYGGAWHLASFVFGVLEAATITAATVLAALTWQQTAEVIDRAS